MNYLLDQFMPKSRRVFVPMKKIKGFTLIELLVVLIIGSVIVTTLLSLVNELLKTNQRETAKSETQRDMQMALDYIAADLREAAYVYDPTCHTKDTTSCPSYAKYVSNKVHTVGSTGPTQGPQATAGSLAVLGFWKVDPLSDEDIFAVEKLNCATQSTTPLKTECDQVKRQKRSLTLVVYSQEWDASTDTSSKWKGKSRIVRYELKKYLDLQKSGFNRSPGYIDPLTDVAPIEMFQTWPYKGGINCQISPGPTGTSTCQMKNVTGGTSGPDNARKGVVLTDFLDDVLPSSSRELPNPICPSKNYSMGPRKTTVTANQLDPDTNVGGNLASTSFFVCIRGKLSADTVPKVNQPALGEVQDIVVFLRGNAYGRARFLQDAYLPTLQTTVALRGIINKEPKEPK
jgi:prepilin-type N-terminal cleavage/methylation domain-containing protein